MSALISAQFPEFVAHLVIHRSMKRLVINRAGCLLLFYCLVNTLTAI